tara:strand:- start:292 stop:831 length:540 start_codon:yes stop_codon:yes gene_type:complete
MLGAEEEVIIKEKMAEATLVDGTEVYTEGELQAGAILFVRAGEGADEDPFAPEGKHETTDGMIIDVAESGEITNVEEKGSEETVDEAEESFEEEEVKVDVKEDFDMEGLVEAIAEMIKPQTEVIEELKKELSVLKERFEVVANEPAAAKVSKNTFKEVLADKETKTIARLELLRSLRQK